MIKARIIHVSVKVARAMLLLETNDVANVAEATEVLHEATELIALILPDIEE